jgi:putative ATP-dependent endonuclease of the OLD family
MELRKIILRNFRCFGEIPTEININNLTVFIGNNNSGKTTIIDSIKKVLGNFSESRIIRSDFHIPKGVNPSDFIDQSLDIELIFDFNELTETDASLDSVPIFFRSFIVDKPGGVPYIRIKLTSTWQKSVNPDGSIDTQLNYIKTPFSNPITDDVIFKVNRKDLDSIRLIVIPAIRDADKQAKFISGTLMHQMIKLIKFNDTQLQTISMKTSDLNQYVVNDTDITIISESLKSNWKSFNIDNRFTEAKLKVSENEIFDILKKITVEFSPSLTERDSKLLEFGDGSKSLFYFSLVSTLLDIEKRIYSTSQIEDDIKPVHTILITEEPENNIAPHLLGQLVSKISQISSTHLCQSIVSSHSESIISRINPIDIRIVFNDNNTFSSSVYEVGLFESDFRNFKFIKNVIKKHPQLYFSKCVILVEGESEKIVLPEMLKARGIDLDQNLISIVQIDGRFADDFWRLLSNLKIPFITLLDLDTEREHGDFKTIAYNLELLQHHGFISEDIDLESGKKLFEDKVIDGMKSWEIDDLDSKGLLHGWAKVSEEFNLYYSYPLDFDLLMLESYPNEYKAILKSNEGPRIPKLGKIRDIELDDKMPDEYVKRIEKSVENVLKSEDNIGKTYSDFQKKLMIWYNYFFLDSGKPINHYKALQIILEKKSFSVLPPVIDRIILRIEEILFGEL